MLIPWKGWNAPRTWQKCNSQLRAPQSYIWRTSLSRSTGTIKIGERPR